MKINFSELKFKFIIAKDAKRPDLLAYVSISLIDDHERYFTVNGFTVRKGKHDGKPYLTFPTKSSSNGRFYHFAMSEPTLWKEIQKECLAQYDYERIPVVEE